MFFCAVRMREIADQNNSKYGHFLRSERFFCVDEEKKAGLGAL